MAETKLCTKCGEVKSLEMFFRNRTKLSGHNSECKDCSRAYRSANLERDRERQRAYNQANAERFAKRRHEYHAANREKRNAQSRAWRKTNPEKRLKSYRAWRKANAAKMQAYERAYREANRDKYRNLNIAWKKSNPRYARQHRAMHPDKYRAYDHKRRALVASISGSFSSCDIHNMVFIQQGHCAYCGRIGLPLEIEHIIPVTRDGTSNDPWNLCLACRRCNASKGDKLLSEWVNRWYLRKIRIPAGKLKRRC